MSKLVKNEQIFMKPSYCVYGADDADGKTTGPDDVMKAQASDVIEKANRYSEEKIRQAEEKAKEIYRKAYDAGFSEGSAKGRKEARGEAKGALDRINTLFTEIDAKKSEMIKDNEKNIIRLSLRIAEKIINKELSEDDKVFVNIFEKAVEEISEQKWVKLTVSDYEAEFATMSSDYLLGMIKDTERLEINVRKDAPRGTCVVETEGAIVDASATTQIESMRETLLGE